MTFEAQAIQLAQAGWRVFVEWFVDEDGANAHVGITRNTSIGIEGPTYCDYSDVKPSASEALALLIEQAGITL